MKWLQSGYSTGALEYPYCSKDFYVLRLPVATLLVSRR